MPVRVVIASSMAIAFVLACSQPTAAQAAWLAPKTATIGRADRQTRCRGSTRFCLWAEAGQEVVLQVTAGAGRSDVPIAVRGREGTPAVKALAASGRTTTIRVAPRVTGLLYVDADGAANYYTLDANTQWLSMLASSVGPLHIFGQAARRLYFLVPQGTPAFDVYIAGSGQREGARVEIFDPDERAVAEIATKTPHSVQQCVEVAVPAAHRGTVWSLAVGPTDDAAFEDCELRLAGVPGYVAATADRLVVPMGAMWEVGPSAWAGVLARDSRLAVWREDANQRVPAVTDALPDLPGVDGVDAACAANECVAFQVVVSAAEELPSVGIEVGPITIDGSLASSGIRATVNPLGFVGEEMGKRFPDKLLPAGPVRVPPRGQQSFWVTIRVPPGAAPGEYRGRITASIDGVGERTFPLRLRVRRLGLPQRPTFRFSVGVPRPGTSVTDDMRLAWWRNVAEHRMSVRTIRPAPALSFDGNEAALDFTEFDKVASYLIEELGMNYLQLPYGYLVAGHDSSFKQSFGPFGKHHTSDEFAAKWVSTIRGVAAHLKQRGWLDYFFHNFWDEPTAEYREQVTQLARLMQRADGDLRPMAFGVAVAEPYYDTLPDWLMTFRSYAAVRDLAQQRRQQGDRIGVYNPEVYDVALPPLLVRELPWWLWRERMYSCLMWTIGAWRGRYASGALASVWVYPHDRPPYLLDSVRWELTRQGLQDYDYLTMLSAKAATVRQTLGVAAKELPDTYISDRICEQVVGEWYFADFGRSADRFRAARETLAAELERIEQRPYLLLKEPWAAHVGEDTVAVSGWVEDGATVAVNGQRRNPGAGGVFSALATLRPGPNDITIEVVERGERTRIIRHITRSS